MRMSGGWMAAVILGLGCMGPVLPDEGMWLYTHPPREQVKAKYGFDLTPEWLDHLMRSSVRFNSGGSGSFVSEDGLVISNHHVGADALQKLSSEKANILRDGYHAKSGREELPCVDLELNVLESIEDVTVRVTAAVGAGVTPEEAFKARRRVMAEIEKESTDRTGMRSDVVTLYQGGAYHLYRFKKYTDVRLVFAPEQQAAFFGGDADNFEYPRYNLDVCFFRVYEGGKPAKVPHHLKWSRNGAVEGELTFVSGHPGRTSRLLTMAELEYLRDDQFPYTLGRLKRMEVLLTAWSQRTAENGRRAKDDLFGVQNSRKARDGGHAGLYDPRLMGKKAEKEAAFRSRLAGEPRFAAARDAYGRIAEAQGSLARLAKPSRMLEGAHGFVGDSFSIARRLLRAADEFPKSNGERLREYSEGGRESFEMDLMSDKPIYEDLERELLSDSLTFLAEEMGAKDPLVQRVLDGKSPRLRAAELLAGTRVRDVGFRRKLYEGGAEAVREAKDPMIELARMVDMPAREVRRQTEALDEVKRQAHAAIAAARFELEGAGGYPDATFTLRLSYGEVKGFEENGKVVPANTVMGGMYQRAAEMEYRPPFDMPKRWMDRRRAVDGKVPFNFVGTHDIIGGNSGSPVVNRAAEFVGIIFDGNIQSLVLDFAYDDVQARAVSVHSAGILEALRRVYGAKALVTELTAGGSAR
jgi:hypothetical protein